MKFVYRAGITIIFIVLAAITLAQVAGVPVSAIGPITSPITGPATPTPTPTGVPLTSPATPTPTDTPAPTSAPATANSGNSNNNNNSNTSNTSGGSSSGSAPSCGDTKPGSAPRIISIRKTGNNQLTITWTKAADPVSYYLVAYGTKSGSLEYGTGAFGNNQTTSYTVNGLSAGKIYYFRVRAGNGCKPGEYSAQVGASTTGKIIFGPATGFQQGVLGASTGKPQPKTSFKPGAVTQPVIPAGQSDQQAAQAPAMFQSFVSFLKSFWSK